MQLERKIMWSTIFYYNATREDNNAVNYNILQCNMRGNNASAIIYYSATREKNNAISYNLLQCN